jgi:RNA polymerase sigma-70 factor (ECF subfamily)
VPPPHSDQARWFAEEVQPHEPDLRSWLRHRFPHTADLDDIVQESYLRLLRARQSNPVSCARAYLFTTARNVAFALFRRPRIFDRSASAEAAALATPQENADVAELVSVRQEIALLLEAIDRLPGRCREIFILRKIEGMSLREIAARLRISEQTVQVQIARGAKRCVQHLRSSGVDLGKAYSTEDVR